MDYEGPTTEDLDNIRALNAAYLRARNHADRALICRQTGRALSEAQIQRLCRAPFLLFSFREHDDEYWDRALTSDPQADFLREMESPDNSIRELQVAGLGFLWQLSRRNAYVARLASGAPQSWCERLARLTLVGLLERAANRADLTMPRFATRDSVSHRLLQSGVSAKRDLQQMSQQLAWQAMLTRNQSAHSDRLPAAACSLPRPAQRVAENQRARSSNSKV